MGSNKNRRANGGISDLRGEQASERRLLLYFCFLVVQAFGEAVGDLTYVEAMLIICNVRVRKSKGYARRGLSEARLTEARFTEATCGISCARF